jgi:glyoxylase-like metal-dependent hydrolase (beta-lactamase superfamily II)
MSNPSFTTVSPHIARLDLVFMKTPYISAAIWLVKDQAGWILVDAGVPNTEALIFERLLAHTGGQKPRLLILTHGHMDHTAAAERLRDEWGVPIAAGRAEIPFLLGPMRYGDIPSNVPMFNLLAKTSGPALVGRNIQLPLEEGQVVGDLTVLHTPGHTPGLVSLWHKADRAILCGDVFMNNGNRLSDPFLPFTYDPRLNHQSQARLAALDFELLLPSHGPASGRAQAQAFIAKRQRPARRGGQP